MTDGWVTPNPKARVLARHVAQLTEAAGGVVSKGRLWRFNETDDSTNYTLEVVNRNATGLIARFGWGGSPGGAPSEWTLSLTKDGFLGTLHDQGGAVYDVKAYGAAGVGGDETTAIDLALAEILANVAQPGGVLYFPRGDYSYNKPLAIQAKFGITIRGDGPNCTKLYPSVRVDKWVGLNFIDMSGSSNCVIEDIQIGLDACASQSLPDCGVYWDGGPAATSNANTMRNVRIEAAFQYAALGINCMASSAFYSVDLYNHRCTASGLSGANDTINTAAMIVTRDNPFGMSPSNGFAGITTAVAGRSCSDLHFYSCEFHDLVCQSSGSPGNTSGILVEETTEVSLHGKNISSSGRCYVNTVAGDTTVTGNASGPRNLIFQNVTMYTEGPTAPTVAYAILNDNSQGHTSPSTELTNLVLDDGCYFGLQTAATAAVIRSTVGTTLRSPRLKNWRNSDGFAGMPVSFATSGTIVEGEIDTKGFVPNIGSSAGVATRTRWLNATGGVIAAAESHGMYQIHLGGAVATLGSGVTAYYGLGSASTTPTAVVPVTFTQASRVRNLKATAGTAPGGATSATYVVTLQKALAATPTTWTDTTIAATVAGTNITASETNQAVTFAANDLARLKAVAAATALTTAWISGGLSVWDA